LAAEGYGKIASADANFCVSEKLSTNSQHVLHKPRMFLCIFADAIRMERAEAKTRVHILPKQPIVMQSAWNVLRQRSLVSWWYFFVYDAIRMERAEAKPHSGLSGL